MGSQFSFLDESLAVVIEFNPADLLAVNPFENLSKAVQLFVKGSPSNRNLNLTRLHERKKTTVVLVANGSCLDVFSRQAIV